MDKVIKPKEKSIYHHLMIEPFLMEKVAEEKNHQNILAEAKRYMKNYPFSDGGHKELTDPAQYIYSNKIDPNKK